MSYPLVSVICLCYNQKSFVKDAIQSVRNQTYNNIELIVVDDGSTDGSKEEIRSILGDSNTLLIDLEKNIGNCAAFNKGFQASHGEFIIDLAADDMLLPPRIQMGVLDFNQWPGHFGIHYSDAFIVDIKGNLINTHYDRNQDGKLIKQPVEGDIYLDLIQHYFICPPTMMMKRKVLEKLNGYDESLSYEDFDFWIRSAREFNYVFNKAPLVKKRIVRNSHSTSQFKIRNKHQFSTFRVCQKIFELNRTPEEDSALQKRINYEIRQCIKTLNFGLIPKYLKLKKTTQRRLSSSSSMDK